MSKMRLVRGDACDSWEVDSEDCEWRWFPICELHLTNPASFSGPCFNGYSSERIEFGLPVS